MSGRIYAIGDVHGQLHFLRAAHALIEEDRARTGDDAAPVVHIGDLVDRGEDSRGVVDCLMTGQREGRPWIVLKGNHDRLFHEQADMQGDPEVEFVRWCAGNWGGRQTVASYGIGNGAWGGVTRSRRDFSKAVPAAHLAFMRELPLWHEAGPLLFVHAGIRPGLGLGEQIEEDLLWIRAEFLHDTRDHGWLVVHGHTPVDWPEHRGNRVAIDTGAGYGRPIVPVVFEGREVFALTPEGREPVSPDFV